jgi:Fe-S cluster assembly protein SufD
MTETSPASSEALRESAHAFSTTTLSALASRPRGGPAWLEGRRGEAASRFDAKGFPSPNDEAFRFTELARVLRVPYAPLAVRHVASPIDALAARRIRIDGGRVDASGLGDEGGVAVRRLRDVLADEPARLEPYLARLATSENGFVAQNTALLDEGVVVVVRPRTGQKAGPLHLAYSGATASPAFATARTLILAERGSELDVIESHAGDGDYLESTVTEVFVAEGASVEHVRVQLGSERSASLATVAVRLARDSRYRSRVFSFGGKLTRVDLRVELAEQGAECSLDGLCLVDGGSLVDHHTRVVHASPRCSSTQRYKGIADGRGVAVFDGTVIVRRGASGTEAHQENRNLLLSNDAVVHAKPHLEIDTDDVKCSHGATVGRLDPAQLFYLRSRGIDEEVARSLLTYAFAREVVAAVSHSGVRGVLEDIVAARLPSGRAATELA